MNESIIYKLSARHQSTDDDKLKLVYRIRAEHVFISVTECIEYIKYAVEDIYNKIDVSIVDINIIDEAICAIIKEVFVTPVEDEHNRSFYRWKLEELYSDLLKYPGTFDFRSDLIIALNKIIKELINISNPNMHDSSEDTYVFSITNKYYYLMWYMYKNVKKELSCYITEMLEYYSDKLIICGLFKI